MSIVIISKWDMLTNQPPTRSAKMWVSNGTDSYVIILGGFPMEGNLQTVVAAREAEIFAEAQISGTVPTATETEIAGVVLWYIANSGTKAAIFDKTVVQESTDITALIAASFPSASAAVKTAWLQLLMSSLLDTRVNAHDKNLL